MLSCKVAFGQFSYLMVETYELKFDPKMAFIPGWIEHRRGGGGGGWRDNSENHGWGGGGLIKGVLATPAGLGSN